MAIAKAGRLSANSHRQPRVSSESYANVQAFLRPNETFKAKENQTNMIQGKERKGGREREREKERQPASLKKEISKSIPVAMEVCTQSVLGTIAVC